MTTSVGHSWAHTPASRWLLAIAAPREFESVANALSLNEDSVEPWKLYSTSSQFDLVWTGVGKSNASGAVARVLSTTRHRGVMSVGIAGVLPTIHGGYGCKILDVVCANTSVFVDEGVQTDSEFLPCAKMGFPSFSNDFDSIEHSVSVLDWLKDYSDHCGPIATVSTCSGTDTLAHTVVQRSGAIAEAMEGASVSLAASKIDSRFETAEIRVISNTAGSRASQVWNLDGALSKLGQLIGRLSH